MASFIPDDKVAEVRNAANIADVISGYVALKKTGRNLVGLCPFHAEKTPSFTVSEEKQIFHCFGCGQGGNVFTFLMLYHNWDFPESVRSLAQQYGIEIPTGHMTPAQRRKLAERERLLEINHKAADHFREMLMHAPVGEPAREYLRKRQITASVIDRFRLGYAPGGWRNLVKLFSGQNISLQDVEKTGLIIAKRQGHYDRFRDRIMFPIVDIHGRVVGFGGRSLDDTPPKYLNSPETLVYHKGRTLYGLKEAQKSCRHQGNVFVVEGYFDLLALNCHGIDNVVASLGTALTREHIRILKGYAERVTLVFDSDEAGTRAAQRAFPLFEQEKTEARVMTLPEGKDPDSYVLEEGADGFQRMADQALGVMEFIMASAIKKYGLSPQGKVKIVEALKEPLGSWPDSVARAVYVKDLAERLDIDEAAVLERIRPSSPRGRSTDPVTKAADSSKLEESVLGIMLQYPDILSSFQAQEIVDSFETAPLKKVGQVILERIGADQPLVGADLIAQIRDPQARNMISRLTVGERWDRDDCLKIVRQYRSCHWKRQERTLLRRIKEAEKARDEALLLELLKEKQRRVQERLGTC